MLKNKFLLGLVVLCSFVTPVFALEDGLSFTTLPSGQKVVIKEVHDNNIVKIDTWINTGSINEDDKTTGISHFLEHLFFKGTQKYPTGTMDKILDSKGAIVNAGTSKDYTHYYIQIPSKDFDLALDLHADMLLNPMIPRKELERERPVVIEEISKTKDSPQTRMFDNLYTIMYSKSNHPYKRTVIGNKDVIDSVTREEILDYYNKFYTLDAYTTIIVGDVEKDSAIEKVANAFSKADKRKQLKVNYPKIKPLDKIERIEDTMDVNKTYSMIAFFAPKFGLKDTYPLDVLSVMLADGKSSILNQDLKEKKELVLSVDSGNYSQKDSGIFYIYTTSEANKLKYIEPEIISQLKKIQQGEFDEADVSKAKNIIKTDTYYSRESISNISDDLGYDFTFSSDINYYDNYLKNIDKVTKEDIIKAANKYLLLNNYAVSTVKPLNFKPVSEITEIDGSKIELTQDPVILEENALEKKYLLESKAKLITKKKNLNSIVAINISIKGSKAIEKKAGSAVLSAAAAMTGTKNYTNTQFANFLDENGIKMNVSASADDYSILIQSTKENLDKAFIALDEVLNRPAFLDSEISKIKARKIHEYKAVKDSPASYVFDEFNKLAYKGTIYGQNSEFMLNAIKDVTREDIIEFYNNVINPNNMNIAVVGDIDDNDIIKKINSIIKPKENIEEFEYSKVKYNKFIPEKNIEQAVYKNDVKANWLALGYKIPGVLDRKEIATLSVINSILGDGMSSRLFVKLREEKGLAYTVGSTVSAKVLDGSFIAYIGTNEASVEEAKKGILEEFEIIKKEMVTTEELNAAKDKIIGKLLISLETNMDEASLLSRYSMLSRNLNALDEYKKMIQDVTQADIIETANKYFSKPYIYTVVRSKPEQK